MPGSGTSTFIDPDDYQASLDRVPLDLLLVTSRGEFKACVTSARLNHLYLLGSEEDFPRIATFRCLRRSFLWDFRRARAHRLSGAAWNCIPGRSCSTAAPSGSINERPNPATGSDRARGGRVRTGRPMFVC